MKLFAGIIALYVALNLLGCSSKPVDETAHWSAQRLYTEAKSLLEEGDYEKAIKYYETLEARYPLGSFAQQAHLEMIYAYYKNDEPESAIAEADRFIKLHPRHSHVDYVYYLKGLVNFERNTDIFDRLLPLDKSQRDQTVTMEAYQSFADLVNRFPHSRYSEDGRQRMIYLRNNLAKHELHVARFYMQRGAYVAAVNRAQKIVESYQRTPSVPDALVILAKAYKIMGLNNLSTDAVRILQLNYPHHEGLSEISRLQIRS